MSTYLPQVWQQTIQSRRSHFASTSEAVSSSLITGLVVACEPSIKCILGNILGISSDDFWRLRLEQVALSIIHYPLAENPPVLQGMNLSDAAMSSIVRE